MPSRYIDVNKNEPVHRIVAGVYCVLELESHKLSDLVDDVINVDAFVHVLAGHDEHGAHGTVGGPAHNDVVVKICNK